MKCPKCGGKLAFEVLDGFQYENTAVVVFRYKCLKCGFQDADSIRF